MTNKTKGFASMTPEKRKEISAMGGKKVHELGKAHVFTHEEAVFAGKKSRRNKRS